MVSIGFHCLSIMMEKDELCKEPKALRCEGEGIVTKEMSSCGEKKKDEKETEDS